MAVIHPSGWQALSATGDIIVGGYVSAVANGGGRFRALPPANDGPGEVGFYQKPDMTADNVKERIDVSTRPSGPSARPSRPSSTFPSSTRLI